MQGRMAVRVAVCTGAIGDAHRSLAAVFCTTRSALRPDRGEGVGAARPASLDANSLPTSVATHTKE